MPDGPSERDRWLRQDDAALLAECDVDTYRASGPGGQKRNKTSSAVRLRHHPSSLMAIAEESRSQHENKARALRRLRMTIALTLRCPIPPAWTPPPEWTALRATAESLRLSPRNPGYPTVVAIALDALDAAGGRISDAAARLDLSTGQLSRFISADGKVLAAANRIRAAHGLKALVRN